MKTHRRRPASVPADPSTDLHRERRETPGSYLVDEAGSVTRSDAPTEPAEASAPKVPLQSAQAIAAALEDAGAEVPPHIQAAVDAAAQAAEEDPDQPERDADLGAATSETPTEE